MVFSLTKRIVENPDKLRSDKERITVRIGIEVKKVEFQKFTNRLRITGKIIEGIEESGHHTITISPGKEITLIKEWNDRHLRRLEEAVKSSKSPEVVILTIEEGYAVFGVVRQWGVEELVNVIRSYGKDMDNYRREFFGEVASALKDIDFQYLILAGPGFTKQDFLTYLKEKYPEFSSKVVICDTSSIGIRGFVEVLKRGVMDKVIGELRIAREAKIMDKFMEEIAKDGKAVYGLEEVRKAYEYGAIEILLVSDKFLSDEREKWDIDNFLSNVEKTGSRVIIMSSEFEPGSRLDALGGIGAILRFKI